MARDHGDGGKPRGVDRRGQPQEVVDQLGAFQERGYDEVVFDMRNTYDEWETQLELLAAQVLPHFRTVS